MKVNFILFALIFFAFLGCEGKQSEERIQSKYWMRGGGPGPHEKNVNIELSDPFDGVTLARTLEIAGLEIKFLEPPPRRGRHFVHLVRTERDANRSSYRVLSSIAKDIPDGEYSSPDILRISIHSVPDGTPRKDSKNLRIRVGLDAARYSFREGRSGGGANQNHNFLIPNPFYGGYSGVFQYGPIIKARHDNGITILLSESIEYRIVVIASDPHLKNLSEPCEGDNSE